MDYIFSLIAMAGGLAFFLFGMNLLGSGLEKLSGGKLERTLELMTNNVFKGMVLGFAVTVAVQSSSATTVIVVGLVNAGVLRLQNAVGVIMGANVGTTVTSIILSLTQLDSSANLLLRILKPTTLGPIMALAGILLYMLSRKTKRKMLGEVLLGFGILFNGMLLMTESVAPLAELPAFRQMFETLSHNPVLGILAGAAVTAIIQSSAASIGILQALAASGIVTFSSAIPIILGQNIGTCVTSLLSSFGASKSAKRAAMVHLYFNLIGTVVFSAAAYLYQNLVGFPFWNDYPTMFDISTVHIVFNLTTTVLFIPFTRLLTRLAEWTIRDRQEEPQIIDPDSAVLDDRLLRSPAMALSFCNDVVGHMGDYARESFRLAVTLFREYDPAVTDRIEANENAIDRMEDRVNNYLMQLSGYELNDQESRQVNLLLKQVSEFERIGDYSVNILELAEQLNQKGGRLSDGALQELQVISDATLEIVDMAVRAFREMDLPLSAQIEPLEETIDSMEDMLKLRHIERLKNGDCTIDSGVLFLELLTNIERISDHCSNVAVYVIGYQKNRDNMNRHEYLKRIHMGETAEYNQLISLYEAKYTDRL